jgi:hypothetical protein
MCAICALFGGDEDDTAKFMTGFMKMRHRGPDAFRIESTSITSVGIPSLCKFSCINKFDILAWTFGVSQT